MASEAEIFFNFMFLLLAYVFIYPPKEFIDIGLSVEQIGAKFHILPPPSLHFIEHHTRRTSLNLLLHASLPALYLTLYNGQFGADGQHFVHGKGALVLVIWSVLTWAAWLLLAATVGLVVYWRRTDGHPLIQELRKYSGTQHFSSVASNIDDEYRRPDKTVSRVNTITAVVATENWVIKTSLYGVRIAHQSDTALIVVKSDTHLISQDSSDSVQFVNIIVKPTRAGVRQFSIRLNALHFAELQDRINRPITILAGVNFSRTVVDLFVEAFKECVQSNPTYETDQELDSCFACMQAVPNVKLQRRCADTNADGAPLPPDDLCGSCFCRPMWCVDCLAKWFASRQDPHEKDRWLQQKCSCPMCRARFCLNDVCMVRKV